MILVKFLVSIGTDDRYKQQARCSVSEKDRGCGPFLPIYWKPGFIHTDVEVHEESRTLGQTV